MKLKVSDVSIDFTDSKIVVDIPDDDFLRYVDEYRVKGASRMNAVRLSNIAPGETFSIGGERFIVLEQIESMIATKAIVISEKPVERMEFGDSANWHNSAVRAYLNGVYVNKIKGIIEDSDNFNGARLVEDISDLTALDGVNSYGKCVDEVRLLTTREYAKYHSILGVGNKYAECWWTLTPYSASSADDVDRVCGIGRRGAIFSTECIRSLDVRPVMVLDSHMFVDR